MYDCVLECVRGHSEEEKFHNRTFWLGDGGSRYARICRLLYNCLSGFSFCAVSCVNSGCVRVSDSGFTSLLARRGPHMWHNEQSRQTVKGEEHGEGGKKRKKSQKADTEEGVVWKRDDGCRIRAGQLQLKPLFS